MRNVVLTRGQVEEVRAHACAAFGGRGDEALLVSVVHAHAGNEQAMAVCAVAWAALQDEPLELVPADIMTVARAFMVHSLTDIDFRWTGLTPDERKLVTPAAWDAFVRWIRRG